MSQETRKCSWNGLISVEAGRGIVDWYASNVSDASVSDALIPGPEHQVPVVWYHTPRRMPHLYPVARADEGSRGNPRGSSLVSAPEAGRPSTGGIKVNRDTEANGNQQKLERDGVLRERHRREGRG